MAAGLDAHKVPEALFDLSAQRLAQLVVHDIIDIAEVKKYAGSSRVNYIQHYTINQALPDVQGLRMTAQPGEGQVLENVFLAGDYLLNGSLNAAMESGRLAALGMMQKRKGSHL